MNFVFSDEDVKLVEKFIEIRNRGFYVSGDEVTNAYNRILNKRVSPTSCGSCLRSRITELETALMQFKKAIEKENKPKEIDMKERMEKVRAARKQKKEE